jgi:hypothetical protein
MVMFGEWWFEVCCLLLAACCLLFTVYYLLFTATIGRNTDRNCGFESLRQSSNARIKHATALCLDVAQKPRQFKLFAAL